MRGYQGLIWFVVLTSIVPRNKPRCQAPIFTPATVLAQSAAPAVSPRSWPPGRQVSLRTASEKR